MKRLVAATAVIVFCFASGAWAQKTNREAADVSAAGQFEGNWTIAYGCREPGFVQGNLCRDPYDEFSLFNLTQEGSRLCGTHLATGHLGNRVDEGDMGPSPSIRGVISGDSVAVIFRSARGDGVGKATLRRVGGTLEWNVVKTIGTENYFPDHAILVPDHRPLKYRKTNCSRRP